MTIASVELLTTSDLVRLTGVSEQYIREALDELGIAKRVGRYRVVCRGDLDAIKDELLRRGRIEEVTP